MIKINFKELERLTLNCGFNISSDEKMHNLQFVGVHHTTEWDHGYSSGEYKISSKVGTPVYDIRRNFYSDLRDMRDFLINYISFSKIDEFILAPLQNYYPFVFQCKPYDEVKDIYFEIHEFFKKNNIKKNSRAGVKLVAQNSKKVIEMVLEGNFRNVSSLCIFFPHNKVIVTMTHHFDISFLTNNFEHEKQVVKKILENHPNLRYYEGVYK